MILPIDDLQWIYCDAPADLGFRAASMAPTFGVRVLDERAAGLLLGWYSMPVPRQRVLEAADKERRIRGFLSRLSVRHRGVLEVAYEQRNGKKDLTSAVVRAVKSRYAEAIRDAERLVVKLGREESSREALSTARVALRLLKSEAETAEEQGVAFFAEAQLAYLAVRGEKPRTVRAKAQAWIAGLRTV